jgi:hypothetical protein
MKNLILFAILSLCIFACKKKTAVSTGIDLSGTRTILLYNSVAPTVNTDGFEVYYDGTDYIAVPLIGLGTTSSWQGWKIKKESIGYSMVPNEFPGQAFDVSLFNFGKNMSAYNGTATGGQDINFEASDVQNVYYIKSLNGQYIALDFTDPNNAIMVLENQKPADKDKYICRFTIK